MRGLARIIVWLIGGVVLSIGLCNAPPMPSLPSPTPEQFITTLAGGA
jgi:hypothetical protein